MSSLYINEVDIASYGVILTHGAYDNLLTYPSLKEVEYNDWVEDDGIDPDLDNIKLKDREVKLSFGVYGHQRDVAGFLDLLTSGGQTKEFEFVALNKTFNLRFNAINGVTSNSSYDLLTLSFTEDNPFNGYTYQAPSNIQAQSVGCSLGYRTTINNTETTVTRDFADYGVYIYGNIKEKLMKRGDVKQALLRTNSSMTGSVYDSEAPIKHKAKDVTLNCFMHLDIDDFWVGYNSLLYDLTRSGGNTINYNGEVYKCYYKSSSQREIAIHDGMIWLKFDIVLCFYKG